MRIAGAQWTANTARLPWAPMTPAPQASRPSDRRLHPRARADWTAEIALADGSLARARVRDVSRSGVCFFVERALPLMSVLSIALRLPEPHKAALARGSSASAARDQGLVRARGAVVRCEKISPALEHFEVAVFLHEISDGDRERLARFVSQAQASPA